MQGYSRAGVIPSPCPPEDVNFLSQDAAEELYVCAYTADTQPARALSPLWGAMAQPELSALNPEHCLKEIRQFNQHPFLTSSH